MSDQTARRGAPRRKRRPPRSAGPSSDAGHVNTSNLTSFNTLPPVEAPTGFAELGVPSRIDEGLARLNATKELDDSNWMAHLFSTSAYIEKGLYPEAIAEGRRTNEIQPHSRSFSFLGYALAKSGNREAARSELAKMLEQSKARWVSPYSVAIVYNGLDDREQTLTWLERGLEQRDPRMVFLLVEPKWNNLRGVPRFQKIMRAVGFPE